MHTPHDTPDTPAAGRARALPPRDYARIVGADAKPHGQRPRSGRTDRGRAAAEGGQEGRRWGGAGWRWGGLGWGLGRL